MFPETPELSISISAKTEMLKMVVELTKHIAVLNQFSIPDAEKISLAVDEATTNVIAHSYKKREEETLRLEFFLDFTGIKIRIIFAGIPPQLQENKVELSEMIKAKRKGGLGVKLMRSIMDSVEYKTEGSINSCEMIKWKREN